MPFQLNFSQRQKYDALESGVTVKTVLRHGDVEINCAAKIDTGSQVCLFEREIGEALGVEIEQGLRIELATLVGTLTAFGHGITLETLGFALYTFVYFPMSYNVQRNILGRQGWLQLVRLAIIRL
ncbi:MAG TPA: hypothetical protein VNO70_10675 [Blastocatellia bacterium]|nr:hypothetical protein [Blastocatellia bacterium]